MSVDIILMKESNFPVNIVQRLAASAERQHSSSRALRDVSGQLQEGDPVEFFQIMKEIQTILKRKEGNVEQP